MKNLFFSALFIFLLNSITAQEKLITGTVTDESGPLPGVSILIKGTTTGTETDFNGQYQIKASKGDVLVFSFVGMRTVEDIVGNSDVMNVVLVADNALEEVVVTAMGISRHHRSTGYAVSNLKADDLQGKTAGVQVLQQNNNNIRIRGIASINKKNQPLYIIDGVPVTSDSKEFKNLNPKDIEKITVLKNATANTIYGNRAANGVIVINAKGNGYESEAYKKIEENQFEHVAFSPLSTFSIDVDKASYSNIRRMINNGQQVPGDAVKIEEMINYFDYDYEQPTDQHPFSIQTEIAACPWDADAKLVKIGIQGKNIADTEIPASNLVFLIDVSGSMSDINKLPLLKSSFKLLVNQLRGKDDVSIVVYAGAAGVVLEPTSGDNKMRIIEALDRLQAGGSTAGGAGLQLAYKLAEKNFKKNGNNRVILATDGDFNVGESSDNAMEDLITQKRKSGVFLTVLGFGMGNYKDSKLEILADKGNGNHAYIDSMQEANRVLGTEFGGTLYTIAKDVKIQVEFNPEKVEGYRLIGYENRRLAAEDFKNDAKDAGELGSGHNVTALYEIIPKGSKSKFLKDIDELKYANRSANTDYSEELLTVKFRYRKPDENNSIEIVHAVKDNSTEFSQASPDFKFAAAVAMFGMKLRNSDFVKNSSMDDIIAFADQSRGSDALGYRAEFIRLVHTVVDEHLMIE